MAYRRGRTMVLSLLVAMTGSGCMSYVSARSHEEDPEGDGIEDDDDTTGIPDMDDPDDADGDGFPADVDCDDGDPDLTPEDGC